MGHEKIKTCLKCGKKWEINKITLTMRDKDSLECDCGETILSWNGAVMYTAKPLKEN